MEADRLALNRRVSRVTTLTKDGVRRSKKPKNPIPSAERSAASRSTKRDDLRRSRSDSYVSDRQVFELDVNGRFVPSANRPQLQSLIRDVCHGSQ